VGYNYKWLLDRSAAEVIDMVKVIYADGKMGMVRHSNLTKLILVGRVVAYKPFDVWIETRRKRRNHLHYHGPERRVHNPY
jgi:hypothetical protein